MLAVERDLIRETRSSRWADPMNAASQDALDGRPSRTRRGRLGGFASGRTMTDEPMEQVCWLQI